MAELMYNYGVIKGIIRDKIEPQYVVEMFDEIDDENISELPTFSCEKCGAIIRPRKYDGVHGVAYEFLNIKPNC